MAADAIAEGQICHQLVIWPLRSEAHAVVVYEFGNAAGGLRIAAGYVYGLV